MNTTQRTLAAAALGLLACEAALATNYRWTATFEDSVNGDAFGTLQVEKLDVLPLIAKWTTLVPANWWKDAGWDVDADDVIDHFMPQGVRVQVPESYLDFLEVGYETAIYAWRKVGNEISGEFVAGEFSALETWEPGEEPAPEPGGSPGVPEPGACGAVLGLAALGFVLAGVRKR